MSEALFTESQQFRQLWLWGLMLVVLLVVAGGAFTAFKSQTVPTWPKALMAGAVVLMLAVIAALYSAELRTQVKPDGVYIRFFPFHLSAVRISAEELKTAEAVEYHPVRDYGGWGIRWSSQGKAYSVGGKHGVKLTFKDPSRKPLLIGSNQAEQLAAAIQPLLKQAQ